MHPAAPSLPRPDRTCRARPGPVRRDRVAMLGIVAACLAAAASGWSLAAYAEDVVQVAQRGRAFQPGELELRRGATVRFVNDDGRLLHHAYAKGDGFSFDTGEQAAGTAVDVRFSTPGTFTVQCGIHPKMRLQVSVR